MRHAINVSLRASHDYPWPPYIPGLFVAGAIIGPQRGGQGRTNYGSHNRSGGTSYGGLSCHKWSPGLTMAAIIGPQRGGLTMAGADQLWQPQSVRGDHLWHERLP